jgi:hypothetical protein
VSIRKTKVAKVVVFHKVLSRAGKAGPSSVQRKATVEAEYKCVGLMFGTGCLLLLTELEKTAAREDAAALAAVYGIFHSLHTQSNPYLKIKWFKAVVQPNMLYACEVRGSKLLALDPREPFQPQVDGPSHQVCPPPSIAICWALNPALLLGACFGR